MKAVQVKKAYELAIVDVEMPKVVNPTDVLVKTKRVGICGSDMHIYHGTNPLATLPRVIGHEVTGEVVEVGSEVKDLKVGDHVSVEPITYCGECYACRKGQPNVCKSLSVFGVHEDGGMREYFVLPERQLHKLNADIPWDETVLVEPYSIGAQAVFRGQVEEGDTVLIQGAGPIGICVLKLAKIRGAKVMITDLSEERLAFAKENGADVTVNPKNKDVIEAVNEWTNNEGVNVVIDAVCITSTVELGVEVVSPAGTVVVLGFGEEPCQIPQMPITKKQVTIVGSRLSSQFTQVVDLVNEGKLRHNGLVTHKFPLEQVQEAFDFIENNPQEVRKALISFE